MRLYDYAPSANCLKARMLLHRLGIDYERVPVDIFDGHTLSDEYARMNPSRRTPVLEPEPGVFLPESNAICVYLAEGSDLLGADRLERAQVLRWLFFEQNQFELSVGGARFWTLTGRHPNALPAARERARGALEALAAGLRGREWLVGDRFTLADHVLYAYAHVAGDAEVEVPPEIAAWVDRVEAQPGHMNDLEPYPENARAGAGRSVHG